MIKKQVLTSAQQQEVLDALSKTAASEVWTQSTLLRAIGKQLAQLRDDFKQLTQPQETKSEAETKAKSQVGKTRLYISLYCAKGNVLQQWERLLVTLPGQLISRPIYLEEKHVTQLISSKTNKVNEAYLYVDVPSEHILTLGQGHMPIDKLGNPLVSLKGKPLQSNYEGTFVHQGKTYQFKKNTLTLI